MNDELQKALSEIINKTMQGVEAGAAFLQAEIPDVIHQLLIWKLAQASIMFFLCIVGFILSIFTIVEVVKNTDKSKFLSLDNAGIPASFCSAITIALSLIGFFTWGSDALQIWLAPKIYLIEYAASLAK